MSLLAPLYIAGLLAVSLPIVFHLIRRTPHGRQDFSSLMFLAPSPPRLTRRSRLNNLLLLLLRAAALSLLAFAFARPLFYQEADLNISEAPGRRIAVLVDTSASMRRGDLWTQARARLDEVLGSLEPNDEVALYTFDQQVRTLFTFSEWNDLDRSQRAAALEARFSEASPTWAATNLGDALVTVVDTLADTPASAQLAAAGRRQLVLISDTQQGSRIESLQGYEWPQAVLLEVKSVAPRDTSNAAIHLVADADDAAPEDGQRLRVRVSNEPGSQRDQFTLAWANEQGAVSSDQNVKVYVAPGRSRIARVPWPAKHAKADRLVLQGDEEDFDNTLFVVPPRREQARVLYVGSDAADDTKGLRYFLAGALVDSPHWQAEIIARRSNEPIEAADLLDARLVVMTEAVADDMLDRLRKFVESGGRLLYVLKGVSTGQSAAKLVQIDAVEIEEAANKNYVLLGRIAFDHPLFTPFADPRFSDFTKIHFWKHRRLKLGHDTRSRVIAAFDNGDPFLVERTIGQGTVFLMTSGWQPADSQLALSTKFVPLVTNFIDPNVRAAQKNGYAVLEPIELPKTTDKSRRAVIQPAGNKIELANGATTFDAAGEPGIYRLMAGGEELAVAVNLDADESRTAPLAVEDLEHRGARLGTQPPAEELATQERQMRIVELENRQKLWRWLIVGVLGILVVETALAGRLAHRTWQQQVTA